MWRIRIKNPETGREYWHGEEYSDRWEGNNPTHWPTLKLAEWTADACREIGRVAEVVEWSAPAAKDKPAEPPLLVKPRSSRAAAVLPAKPVEPDLFTPPPAGLAVA